MENSKMQRLWNKYFILVLIIGTLAFVATRILDATVTLYADSLGIGTSFSGLIVTTFSISAALVRIISGNLTDRFGRRIFLATGSILFAVSVFGLGALTILPALLAARVFQGMGFSTTTTAAGVAAVDVIPEHRMGEGLGFYSLSFAVSMAAGPMIGLALASKGQFRLLYTITAIGLGAGFVLSLFVNYQKKGGISNRFPGPAQDGPAESIPPPGGIWKYFERKALPASLMFMLFCISLTCIVIYLPLYAKDYDIRSISIFFLVEAFAMVLVRFITAKVFDRHGPLPVLVPGLILGISAYLLLLVFKSDVLFLLPAILIGTSLGICQPILNALAIQDIPFSRRGTASGTFFLLTDCGFAIGASLWGVLLDLSNKSYTLMFLLAAALILLSLLLFLLFYWPPLIKMRQALSR